MEHLGYIWHKNPHRSSHIVKHFRGYDRFHPDWNCSFVLWLSGNDYDLVEKSFEMHGNQEIWWSSFVQGDLFWSCFSELNALEMAAFLGLEIELCACCIP